MNSGRIKSLASDTLIYGIFTVIGRFLTFMLTPIYTNYLDVVEVGDIINIFSLIAFINILLSIGMDSSFFRFYKKDDATNNKTVFSLAYYSIFIISVLITLFVFLFANEIAPLITASKNGADIVRWSSLLPLFDSLSIIPLALLRMRRRAKKFAWTRFIMIIAAVSLNIIFLIGFKMKIEGVIYAQLISSLIGFLLLSKELIEMAWFRFNLKLFKEMLWFGLPTLPATLAGMVLQVADRPILKLLTNSQGVAMYGVNYRLGLPMMLFVSIFEYAWKPFYLSHYEDKDAKNLFSRIFTYYVVVAAFVFLITVFFIEFIVKLPFIGGRFINPEYWSGMFIIPIILVAYFFFGVFNNFAAGFQINKQTKYLPLAVGTAAISNILMNFILIPIIGYQGAAWATLAAYFISATILYFLSQKVYPRTYEWKRIIIIICSTFIVYFLIEIIPLPKNNYTIILLIRSVGIIIFVLLLVLFKFFNKSEINLIRRLLQRK